MNFDAFFKFYPYFWVALGIVVFILSYKFTLEDKYKKFYPLPICNLWLSITNDKDFKGWEKKVFIFLYQLVFLPITLVWPIAWCVWKLMNKIADQLKKSYLSINIGMDEVLSTESTSTAVVEQPQSIPVAEDNSTTEDAIDVIENNEVAVEEVATEEVVAEEVVEVDEVAAVEEVVVNEVKDVAEIVEVKEEVVEADVVEEKPVKTQSKSTTSSSTTPKKPRTYKKKQPANTNNSNNEGDVKKAEDKEKDSTVNQ